MKRVLFLEDSYIMLPVESILPQLKEALSKNHNAVLIAQPGAGKTTRVPLALLKEGWLDGRKIVMLEPRRLAARSAARYMAGLLGEKVGETVGFRVKMDTCVGPNTRIEVITEGILTRMLQNDPSLEEAGLIIFDEFHERSLHADLGLALCLQSQELLRQDLKFIVMSATLEAKPVSALLGGAPVLSSEGRSFPVETRYLSQRNDGPIELAVVKAISASLANDEGDLLVFLPGAGDIRRVESKLMDLGIGPDVLIAPLFGNLPYAQQDQAIEPSPQGKRKIVLATSIAETSITVEGVRIVIDSGLMRISRFTPRTGMSRLETVRVSRASADQRRGRAGRMAPGVCYRLWTTEEERQFIPFSPPEILESDLAPLALELAAWGVSDPSELSWLDPPPHGAMAQARELLSQLGAMDAKTAITLHGREMAELGLHPRLAHMILKGKEIGYGGLACELAALVSERDILRSDPSIDIQYRIEILREVIKNNGRNRGGIGGGQIDLYLCRRIIEEANYYKRIYGVTESKGEDIEMCGVLLAFAYPDRVGQRRGDGRFLLSNGRGAFILRQQALSKEDYLVAVELDDQGTDSRILQASSLSAEQLESYFAESMAEETYTLWDKEAQSVRVRKVKKFGALVLQDRPVSQTDPDLMLNAILDGIREEGLSILPWTKPAVQFRQRMLFIHAYNEEWPDVSDEALSEALHEWLGPHVYGLKSRTELQRLNLAGILESMLSWEQRRKLDEYAPTHFQAPSGSRIPIDYSNPSSPILSVRLQEMFGLEATPRIARGKVALTLHLLSPAHRPVQITQDLANFWNTTYFEVKKDLKGRYSKHYWPEDPLEATPTNRVRPRN
jgi:ATP-dependent helicase HrpB